MASTTPVFDIKSALTSGTPFYVALGMTDLAVEKVREAGARATEQANKGVAEIGDLPTQASDRFAEFRKQLAAAPATVKETSAHAFETAIEFYEDLATRGEKVVDRIRNQSATKELMEQFKNTEAQAKGAATAARKSVASIEESAKAAFTTGANEVSKVAEKLVDGLSDEAKSTVADVKAGAERTAAAAKSTATTARKTAKTATAKAKATSTSARKTAAAATEAAKDAAAKVGA
ncbi:MAG: hypothetical protein LKG20_00120 [Tetrasphaera jenkinsii]|jgi:heparin binding hemagglutinin HbhA|nr:hypothetical protein [Tetrasphaera jenkinsii]